MTTPEPLESVVLREQRDTDGSRRLGAEWRKDLGIVIEGQDLGPAVERAFGEGLDEYEWGWVIRSEAVEVMVAALGGVPGDDPLRLLATWYASHGGIDPGIHLREAGVPVEFWSRVGD
jgi:hypothetical protein